MGVTENKGPNRAIATVSGEQAPAGQLNTFLINVGSHEVVTGPRPDSLRCRCLGPNRAERGTVMETKIPPDKIVEPGIREFSEKDAETLRNAFN